MKTSNCTYCNKELEFMFQDKESLDDPDNILVGGELIKVYAGYGTEVDGNIYLITLCDNCLKKGKFIGNYF